MPDFQWTESRIIFADFGGTLINLTVHKTGLPFYDALRLYGAIDIYIGTREDVCIRDAGDRWLVKARARLKRIEGRDMRAFSEVRGGKKKPNPSQFCDRLRTAVLSGERLTPGDDPKEEAPSELDPALQSGIRGVSAADYDSMNSSSNPRCKAKVPLSEALHAYAGRRRTESVGEIRFLPVFEGPIDLGKLVSPLRAWLNIPNPLCAQVLMLLSLKTALWAEGYDRALSAVTYSKRTAKTSFNYSGIILIDSTAIGKIENAEFCATIHRVFRRLVQNGWKNNKATASATHALAVAEWLMHPLPKTLGPMIAAQEFLIRDDDLPLLLISENVRNVFAMTYPKNDIDYDAVRQLAKTTSSAIYRLGLKDKKGQRKRWYDEVVALRNAPTKESFRHKILTLIEQGRAQNSWIETFDPKRVLESMGEDRPSFERFRDCFRMYLIQESAPKGKTDLDSDATSHADDTEGDKGEDA